MTTLNDTVTEVFCSCCGEPFPLARYNLKYRVCIACADKQPQPTRTVVPINKSNYMYITDLEQLKQLNPKRTTT